MRVLFDQGTPAPLRHALAGHAVVTAYELGWATLKNGELLPAAQKEGFEVFVTTDRNLRYQQNLADRSLAIVVLSTTSWPPIQQAVDQIQRALDGCTPATFLELAIP